MVYAGTKDGTIYGFYLEADGLQNVFEVTNEEHMALLDGQSSGKVITFHADGKPTLEDPPAPTTEELAERARSKRDDLIEAVSWRIERSGDIHADPAVRAGPPRRSCTERIPVRHHLADTPGMTQ